MCEIKNKKPSKKAKKVLTKGGVCASICKRFREGAAREAQKKKFGKTEEFIKEKKYLDNSFYSDIIKEIKCLD